MCVQAVVRKHPCTVGIRSWQLTCLLPAVALAGEILDRLECADKQTLLLVCQPPRVWILFDRGSTAETLVGSKAIMRCPENAI